MSERQADNGKDGPSDTSSDSKMTKSADMPKRVKERQKLYKKKKSRSATSRRLSGGADHNGEEEANPAEHAAVKEEPEDDYEARDHHEEASCPASRPSSGSPSAKAPLPTTGDPRVDEMLERALENLEEAGKALASLGENVEHELKLFLVELMGRTRKWSSQVDGKIEWARRDIMELAKELSSRIAALADCRRELEETREHLATVEARKSQEDAVLQHRLDIKQEDYKSASGMRSMQATNQEFADGAGGSASMACSKQPSRCASRILQPGPCDEPTVDVNVMRAEAERLQQCCAEFEQEVLRLRKENEKIAKERAEYENAVQRALLKGVSSLNVETLKVLKCNPMPACCPTGSASTTIEPVPKIQYPSSPGTSCALPPCPAPPCPPYNNGGGNHCGRNSRNNSRETLHNNGGRRQHCPSAGHNERKSRKSRAGDNMLLLLHQRDAESAFGMQPNSVRCCNDPPLKKAAVCGGGNCGKNGRSSNGC